MICSLQNKRPPCCWSTPKNFAPFETLGGTVLLFWSPHLIICKNTDDFCTLTLCSVILLNTLTHSRRDLSILWNLLQRQACHQQKEAIGPSLLIYMPLVSSSPFKKVTGVSRMMLSITLGTQVFDHCMQIRHVCVFSLLYVTKYHLTRWRSWTPFLISLGFCH